jgi:hypothetical protein
MTSNTASPKARTVLRDPVLQGDGTVLREAATMLAAGKRCSLPL